MACRNAQPFGKDGELIGDMVAIGVFANPNAVAVLSKLIRVVQRLANPQPPALVPVHRNWLGLEIAFVCVPLNGQALQGVTKCFIDSSGESGFCISVLGSPCVPHCRLGV